MYRVIAIIVLALTVAPLAWAEPATSSPRDLWPQATSAAREGDLAAAGAKTGELVETGKAYGLKSYPLYATSAASLSRQADRDGRKDLADWAANTAKQLDARSSGVAFGLSDRAADRQNWGSAIPMAATGLLNLSRNYRSNLLSRADILVVLAAAILLTGAIFSLALMLRYGRAASHDFREMLSRRLHGGSVSVIAFALLFAPLFLWLGPIWLIFYWFVLFFGYASATERVFIVILALLIACVPIATDVAAHWMAGVDSPVVLAAVSSAEQMYQPEALRRLQDFAAVVPDNATLQLLLGNLQLYEGNEQQAAVHYRRAVEINDAAGAHVNLGNLHFLQNDFAAAMTEYQKAERLDTKLAIAFYNDSVASGETYKFEEQGQKLEQAKKIDRDSIEKLAQSPPAQKVVIYHPPIEEAWNVSGAIAQKGTAQSIFGSYSYLDLPTSILNPLTLGALLSIFGGVTLWGMRRKNGFAGQCIKCGRTFCHRCKSSRESATYCTQCIHIYLKRDGVSLDTKRAKLEEVSSYHGNILRRNRIFASFLPGSAQVLEGRTIAGVLGAFLFVALVVVAVCVGRLAPAIGPTGSTAHLIVRAAAIAVAVILWIFLSLPVYRRKTAVA